MTPGSLLCESPNVEQGDDKQTSNKRLQHSGSHICRSPSLRIRLSKQTNKQRSSLSSLAALATPLVPQKLSYRRLANCVPLYGELPSAHLSEFSGSCRAISLGLRLFLLSRRLSTRRLFQSLFTGFFSSYEKHALIAAPVSKQPRSAPWDSSCGWFFWCPDSGPATQTPSPSCFLPVGSSGFRHMGSGARPCTTPLQGKAKLNFGFYAAIADGFCPPSVLSEAVWCWSCLFLS